LAVFVNAMHNWPPGTAERLTGRELREYSQMAHMKVQKEQERSIDAFLAVKVEDDTARAMKLLRERGAAFSLSDLVTEPCQRIR